MAEIYKISKNLPNFRTPNNPIMENFKSIGTFSHPSHLEFRVPHLGMVQHQEKPKWLGIKFTKLLK